MANQSRANAAPAEKKVNESEEESSGDDEWFASQRKSARTGLSSATGGARRPQTATESTAVQAELKRRERENLMKKLKK